RDRMIVYAGSEVDGTMGGSEPGQTVLDPARFDDTYALDFQPGPAWVRLAPAGTQPGIRARHSAVYDADNDRMVIINGVGRVPVEMFKAYFTTQTATYALSLGGGKWLDASVDPVFGSVSTSPPGPCFAPGTPVTVTMTPTFCYFFDHWSGDAAGSSSQI